MSDGPLITETIMDTDGIDPEAFARLYTVYVETEAVFGSVPMEVDAEDGLTITIHDPVETRIETHRDDVTVDMDVQYSND